MKFSEFLIGLILLSISTIWKGFVLTKLWLWFIVPFFGLHPLSIPFAIGFFLILRFLSGYSEDNRDTTQLLVGQFGGPLLILIFGFILTFFL